MAYEFDGKRYERASTHQKEWGAKLIAELDLRGDERILDLGCGDGALTARLAARVPDGSVLGVDSSQSMLDTARGHQRDNLFFLRKDIGSLAFENEFDLVFSNATLHWIKDHRTLLGNVHRSLCRNGVIRFNFAGEGNCIHFIRVIKSAITHRRYAKYFSGFVWPWFMPSVEEYNSIVQQFPFRDIKVWGEIADKRFPDEASMVKWIEQPSLVPFLESVAPIDKESFKDFVIQRMTRETVQKDGTYFETFRRVNVYAKK